MVKEKNKNKKKVWPFLVVAILVILFFFVRANHDKSIKTPANIQLYKFIDLSSNRSTNVELWLLNIGEETATNITVFVRARTENGTVLFENQVTMSSVILRGNETCTGQYTVVFENIQRLYHTIEISWDEGRNTYSKETLENFKS